MSKFDNSDSGCPVFEDSEKCGEMDTLEIMDKFKRFYEKKLQEVDIEGGGDCLEVNFCGCGSPHIVFLTLF